MAAVFLIAGVPIASILTETITKIMAPEMVVRGTVIAIGITLKNQGNFTLYASFFP